MNAYIIGGMCDDSMDYFESFVSVFLALKNEVLGIMKISEGSLYACIVDVSRIFQGALLINSLAIILAHNHPSGSLKPSEQDMSITREVKQATEVFED